MRVSKGVSAGLLLGSVLLAFIAVFSAGGYAGWFLYRKAVINAERYREVSSFVREAPRADSLLRVYQNLDTALGQISKGQPTGSEGSEVLQLLVNRAKARGLEINSLQALEEKNFSAYRELPFLIETQGLFPQEFAFIRDLDSLERWTRVHTLTFEAKAMNKPEVHSELEFSVYVPEGRP